jgi:anti-sigma B factor antagonist
VGAAERQVAVPDITTVGDGSRPTLVFVEGEVIDPTHGTALYDAICAAVKKGRPGAVEVDLSGVDLLGSVGINALLQARQEAQNLGCTVTLVAASAIVRRVLDITGLSELFGLAEG